MGKYVVIDLEMCKVPKNCRYRYGMEIIQIGAVLLDESYRIIDAFARYVAPEYGYIDSFITHLTGIRFDSVREAGHIGEVLESFLAWLPDEEDLRMVSWSMTDRSQLEKELWAKGISIPGLTSLYDTWIDCQKLFGGIMEAGRRQYNLEEALIASDIDIQGQFHDGLSDARNTALLFAKIRTEPDFRLNRLYMKAREEEPAELTFSMGSLFSGIVLEGSVA